MERASAVLVTRASQAQRLDELKATVRAVAPVVPVWITDFAPSAVVQVGGEAVAEPSALKGERVLAVCGIGNPESFRRLLGAAGAMVVDHCVFPDHHAYSVNDLQRVRSAAAQAGVDRIVTTEKDAVKLAQLNEVKNQQVAIWAVRIELQWLEGLDEWKRIVLKAE
jgi:tetraacyldisaccharide 4'-kinase